MNKRISLALSLLICCALSTANQRASVVQQKWIATSTAELKRSKERLETIDPTLKAKNIILFLGDGMGVSTLTAARTLKAQLKNDLPGPANLYFEDFPFLGLAKTYNTDKMTPDSAGAATAYLCGVKTNRGVLGVDERVNRGDCKTHIDNPDSKIKCVAQYAAEAGKSVGLVTTKSITDASPTPVYASSPERDWEGDFTMPEEVRNQGCRDIASQLVDSAPYINVALGGGIDFFNASNRVDKRDLPAEWLANMTAAGKKPAYVNTRTELNKVDTSATTHLLGLFAGENMLYSLEQKSQTKTDQPSLVEMALKAYDIVSKDPDGYFLFIEGAKIDHAHHRNLAKHSLNDVLAMEEAIIEIMKKINLKDTLVIVTADHSHVFTFGSYLSRSHFIFNVTDAGVDSNKKPYTSLLYANGPGFAIKNDGSRPNLTNEQTNDQAYAFETAVPLSSETHGAEEVAIYAKGPQAHLISALVEQSTVGQLMLYSSCLGPHAEADHCKQTSAAAAFNTQAALLLTAVAAAVRAIGGY